MAHRMVSRTFVRWSDCDFGLMELHIPFKKSHMGFLNSIQTWFWNIEGLNSVLQFQLSIFFRKKKRNTALKAKELLGLAIILVDWMKSNLLILTWFRTDLTQFRSILESRVNVNNPVANLWPPTLKASSCLVIYFMFLLF